MTVDYLAIGHVTEDVWRDGSKSPGGTVMYSARTARVFVPEVGVLTAAAADFDVERAFAGIRVTRIDSPRTTEFENIYLSGHRQQVTRPSPVKLSAAHLRGALLDSRIMHLAPVCDEIALDLVQALPETAFIGVTPQGWMRRWDANGHVIRRPEYWSDAEAVLELANAAVLSLEDVEGDWAVLHHWATRTRLLVVTQGQNGCTALFNGDVMHVPAPRVDEVDPTGAGDIFAAALFIALNSDDAVRRLTHDRVRSACERANCVAAESVTRRRPHGIPDFEDVRRCITI